MNNNMNALVTQPLFGIPPLPSLPCGEEGESCRLRLKDPVADVLVLELAESSVNIRARWWIKPPRRIDDLLSRDKVISAIKQKLYENGIDLPYPTRQILFHDQTEETDGDRARQREG